MKEKYYILSEKQIILFAEKCQLSGYKQEKEIPVQYLPEPIEYPSNEIISKEWEEYTKTRPIDCFTFIQGAKSLRKLIFKE